MCFSPFFHILSYRCRTGVSAFGLIVALMMAPVMLPASAFAQSLPDELEQLVEQAFAQHDLAGMAVALVDKQGVVFQAAHGWADREAKQKTDQHTQFRTGSLTMSLTAAAIMQLATEGKLLLDRPVAAYLPDWPDTPAHQAITIRHLLTHHSGLPLSYFKGMWTEDPQSSDTTLAYIRQVPLSFTPGKIFSFSNLGYVVLGEVIRQVAGMAYEDYIQQQLFQPLGMTNSGFAISPASPHLARSYRKGKVMPELQARDTSALGLVSNIHDLSRYVQMLLNDGQFAGRDVLKFAAVRRMFSAQNTKVELDLDKKVGLGWRLSGLHINGVKQLVWRFGASPAHRSRIVLLPEYGIGVILLSNDASSFEALEQLSKVLLEKTLQTRFDIPPYTARQQMKPDVNFQQTHRFAEAYSSYAGIVRILKKSNSRMFADVMGWRFRLVPRENGWYSLTYDLLGFIPINMEWIARTWIQPAVISGESVLIAQYEGENYLFGTAIQKQVVSPVWRKRFGEYRMRNPDTVLASLEIETGQLMTEDGYLVFEYRLPVLLPMYLRLPLLIESDTQLRLPGLGSGFNAVILAQDNGATVLNYAGYELELITGEQP